MAIAQISLNSFRNHHLKEIDFFEGLTVIWGENGSGKTSLLEAVHIMSFGKSFKTHRKKTLIKDGENSFVIRGRFNQPTHKDVINAEFSKTGKQTIKLNGKIVSGRKELIGRNNVVVLSPEEESLTKGPPKNRRQFFDRMFSVVSPQYLDTLQKYNRILKQRNSSLVRFKEKKTSFSEVLGWTDPLLNFGLRLWKLRGGFLKIYEKTLFDIVDVYDDNNVKIKTTYKKKPSTEKEFQELLTSSEEKDKALGRTTVGPHCDDVSILWGENPIKIVGSQGEHKLSLVFLKLSEMLFIKNETETYPTLLLDDLFAKLDIGRSKKLVLLLNQLENDTGKPIQTVITTTDLVNIENCGILVGKNEIKTHHFLK